MYGSFAFKSRKKEQIFIISRIFQFYKFFVWSEFLCEMIAKPEKLIVSNAQANRIWSIH